ncbi:MAG: membrane dipeptidase [bacterium]|nr:dipeptidase [Acidimicrobiia bacterium]MCY4651095.1 membrane dipeptidase [bacterium]
MSDRSVVVDGCAPLLAKRGAWQGYLAGGVDLAIPTVATHETPLEAMPRVRDWRKWIADNDSLFHAASPSDLGTFAEGRLGIAFHFQNTTPLGESLDLLETYARLGLRMIQLTYNHRNAVGDGCMDPNDRGLTAFGRDVVAEMNRLGIVVDLSHTGHRTTLEAIDASEHPTVFSHSNAQRLFDHPRNITDTQIRAVAEGGGLVGVNTVSSFLRSDGVGANLSDLLDHIDYLVEMIGSNQVCLGLDFWIDGEPDFGEWTEAGLWTADDLSAHVGWPRGISGPGHIPRLRQGLADRGYSPEAIAGIMGDNWIRLFTEVWT